MKTCLEANKAEREREHVLSTLYYCFCFVLFIFWVSILLLFCYPCVLVLSCEWDLYINLCLNDIYIVCDNGIVACAHFPHLAYVKNGIW